MSDIIIEAFHDTVSGTFSYLVADPGNAHAVIIDPVLVYDSAASRTSTDHVDKVLARARELGCEPGWVIETHAHADHFTAAQRVRQQTGAKIAISQGIRQVQDVFTRIYNLDLPTDGSQFDRLMGPGEVLEHGTLSFRTMAVPGHTSDSMAWQIGNAVFVGDTLFRPEAGTARCDFPGGDAGSLYDSIQQIYALPDDTQLYLCHDYPAKGETARHCVPLSEMRRNNIHIRHDTPREEFIKVRTARDATLGTPTQMYAALQANIRAGRLPDAENNGQRYLKIPLDPDLKKLLGAS